MIKLENVTKTFGSFKALDDLSLSIPKGSIYGLMGLNGSGKTTIIKHICGYIKADAGNITIDELPVFDNQEVKEKIALVPDDLFFFKNYSPNEMAKLYKKLYKNWNQERFVRMIEDFGLNPKGNIGKFSKGMKKQVAFALALSTMPEYLILDEPVDGLDPIVRHKLWKYVMEDVADREMTVLVSSHNAKEMEDVCNYIGILSKGRVVFEGDLLDMMPTSIEEIFIEKLGGEPSEK